MLKKSIMFIAGLIIAVGGTNAFAAASVKKLGTTTASLGTVKTLGAVPKQQVAEQSDAVVQAKAAKTPKTKLSTLSVTGSERLPTIATIVPVTSTITNPGTVRPNTTGVVGISGVELDGEDGNYVTNVSTNNDGTVLKVKKTNSVILPSHPVSYSGQENGEMWIVER